MYIALTHERNRQEGKAKHCKESAPSARLIQCPRTSLAAFDPALKVGNRISQAARDRNLIAHAMPHAPPLVLTESEIDEMVSISKAAVNEVAQTIEG